jgi:5-methylcytosine-specific restriction endonuclease McrA
MPRKRKSSVSDVILGKDFKNPFETSDEPKRDPRRYFGATQKREILNKQNYKCANCGKKLGVGYHFHHIKPWSSGGKTTVEKWKGFVWNMP